MRKLLMVFVLSTNTAFGSDLTLDPDGIDSLATGLDGTGIDIGMADPGGRAGKKNYDNAEHSASNTIPVGVYFQNSGGMDAPNSHVTEHATTVAGVMIGKLQPDPSYVGVAPNASGENDLRLDQSF